jgi:DNA-directed RNA polymerase subunit RPC12/RpoP
VKRPHEYECQMCGAVYEVEHEPEDKVAVVCWHCSNDVICKPRSRRAS